MHNPLRRRILSWLLVLPFSGRLIVKASEIADDIASPELALNAVRFFNTMEAWHKLKFKTHVSKSQLLEWEVLQNMLNKLPDKESNRTEGLRSKMNVEAENLLPGWYFKLHLSPKSNDYLIIMRSDEMVLASDAAGVIYHGSTMPESSFPQSYVPLREVLSLRLEPLTGAGIVKRTTKSRAASIMRRVAFMNVSASSAPTGCGCNCSGTAQGACWNSGFESCPWCCCAYCDNCCLNSEGGGCVDCHCSGYLD
jgi:hypothetical protein